MSDEEHSESEFYYTDKLVFNENFEEKEKTWLAKVALQFQIVQRVDKDSPRVSLEAKSRHGE